MAEMEGEIWLNCMKSGFSEYGAFSEGSIETDTTLFSPPVVYGGSTDCSIAIDGEACELDKSVVPSRYSCVTLIRSISGSLAYWVELREAFRSYTESAGFPATSPRSLAAVFAAAEVRYDGGNS